MKRYAGAGQHVFGGQQVSDLSVSPHGNHVRVLDNEKLISNLTVLAPGHEILLEGKRLRVADTPEISKLTATH